MFVNEPTKVRIAGSADGHEDDDADEVKLDRVVYCPSTFTKLHAFKVAPPLPTFEVSELKVLEKIFVKLKLNLTTNYL